MEEIYSSPVIYLAGPIFGAHDKDCLDWRRTTLERYPSSLDPMRRDYRGAEDDNIVDIVEWDKIDIDASDIILANCPIPSAGTSMEIFYAWQKHKVVITVVPHKSEVSPWIKYHSTIVIDIISNAFDYIDSISSLCNGCNRTTVGSPRPKCGCYNVSYTTIIGYDNDNA